MRKFILASLAIVSLAACSSETTAPVATDDLLMDAGAYGTALTSIGGYEAGVYQDRLSNALPDELKLSTEQKAQIRALVEAFESSTKADREALAPIFREARDAAKAGKSRAEINAILARGAPLRARLVAAESKLRRDIDAVLTPEQRAWIASHSPRGCRAEHFPPLTDAQKAQIRALEAAFAESNKADVEAVKAVLEEARVALQAGKSRAEINAILAKGAEAISRLATARRTLREQIIAVLTPEQRASGCLPLG